MTRNTNPNRGRIRAALSDATGVFCLFAILFLLYVGTP